MSNNCFTVTFTANSMDEVYAVTRALSTVREVASDELVGDSFMFAEALLDAAQEAIDAAEVELAKLCDNPDCSAPWVWQHAEGFKLCDPCAKAPVGQ